jgi:hypothetical protein
MAGLKTSTVVVVVVVVVVDVGEKEKDVWFLVSDVYKKL